MTTTSNTTKQFVQSTLLGIIPSSVALITSDLLDKVISQEISNFIGIIIAYGADYFIQEKIFLGNTQNRSRYRNRYIIAVCIAIVLIQTLFILTLDYVKKYHKTFYEQKWNKYVLLIRWIIKAVVYVFFEFPFQKLWVFKKPA